MRQALETAVAARRPSRGRLSADVSGGLDSTSLCFLAARAATPDLLTFRWAETDVADDAAFAAHPASGLRHAEHVVLGPAEMPCLFADTGDTEAPYPFVRTLARVRRSAQLLAAHDARVHLAGHGGDTPILPEVIAARTTKRGCDEDLRVGLRRHLPRILNLFADSALATHGLINPDLLRRALLAPQVDNAAVLALEDLLGCETWLRAALRPSAGRNSAAAALAGR